MTERSSIEKARSRGPHAHPLLRAFPLTIMTLATFLVVFALMMARLQAGADPALRAAGTSALIQRSGSAAAVSTRASGAATVAATSSPTPGATSTAIVTRSSATTGGGTHDD